jgi:hypothetical protein
MNGDYPDLKPSSADSRDGNIYWDMPEYRRNFGEPMHHDFDFQQETRLVKQIGSKCEIYSVFTRLKLIK